MTVSADFLQETLGLLILRMLPLEPMGGWGVAERIQQIWKGALQIGQGSLCLVNGDRRGL